VEYLASNDNVRWRIYKANLKFDDFGNPMSTAQGNMADIICDYGDSGLTVEVTI
jgi:hypothetical protein